MKKLKTLPRTLPTEIFYQHIFLNLPVKSLLRFKGVCKQWNDLIKEPNFVRMHLHHTNQQNNSQRVMMYSDRLYGFYSLDHQTITSNSGDYIQAVELNYPVNTYINELASIAGSVNGLVCMSSAINWDQRSTIIVSNPTTRVRKVLPPHPFADVTEKHGIGFGYDSTADDYNVVRILLNGKESRIDIYSLKTNSWKLFMCREAIPGYSRRINNRIRVCSVDGSIFWLASHKPPHGNILEDDFIACFDLKEKNKKRKLIREIPVPGDFGMVYGFAELKLMGGCLRMFKVGKFFRSLEMWTLMKINENKNDEVDQYIWTNRVVINTSSFFGDDFCHQRYVDYISQNYGIVPKYYEYSVPICLSKDGKIVLRVPNKIPSKFVLYNTDTKSIEGSYHIRCICERGVYLWGKAPIQESQMYIESLVSPIFG